ncbi:MAG: hypothetical protein K0R93_1832 [Anaerosolibacter sp.]|jgi:hypothetical protein|uniref:hypothetical protein n=1 Tax=Anaerosolibacter sp. TaxID=1872527 RepID=UPI002616DAEE|nr:hypothetical protein [Anaerosolibacter sp.]MDF2546934.1 hypothetical protein [Anaerosolibacter sp.]
MIMIWNQKEVFVGQSVQRFGKVCEILATNNIPYKHKIVNNSGVPMLGSGRVRTGNSSQTSEYSFLYYVYVHKRDYDTAYGILLNL